MDRRAVSPVIGLVLLLGITAIASMGLFLAGMTLAESTQSSAVDEQAEQSMAQLAESADQLAAGEAASAEFSIRGASSAQVRGVPDAGQINVTVTNRSSGNQIFSVEEPLGAVIYERDDGTEIAYQGGGVWRRSPNGYSQLVRAPEFHYRERPDPTITFPVTLVRNEFSQSGQVDGQIRARESRRLYPDRPSHYNPLHDGSVLIRIDSDYCQGWEAYFEHYTDGSAAEDCSAGTPGQLEIQFSVPFELNGLGSGVMLGGGSGPISKFNGINNSSQIGDSDDAPSATSMVESKLENATNGAPVLPNDATIDDPGLYYDDGNLSNGDVTFNTSKGDIEIASDQTPVVDGNISIEGDGNVTIFITRNLVDHGSGEEVIGDPENSSQLRVFVHSDVSQIGYKGQNSDFHGLLYAPNSEVYLFRGNNSGSGAIVAESIDWGKKMTFDLDPDLANIQFYEELGDAPFYYLHVSETVIDVEN